MKEDSCYVIAIDGPAGSGKSTVARELSKILGIRYLDTGAFYRALAFYLWNLYLREKPEIPFPEWTVQMEADPGSWAGIRLAMEFREDGENRITLDGKDISREIRMPEITEKIKYISDKQGFRDFVNERVRALAKTQSLVMDGRDIGTEVFPNTPYKFFLTASPEVRAKRRWEDLRARNIPAGWEEVFRDLVQRDHADETRKIAPLRRAKDAILIDTDGLPINVVIDKILSEIRKIDLS